MNFQYLIFTLLDCLTSTDTDEDKKRQNDISAAVNVYEKCPQHYIQALQQGQVTNKPKLNACARKSLKTVLRTHETYFTVTQISNPIALLLFQHHHPLPPLPLYFYFSERHVQTPYAICLSDTTSKFQIITMYVTC